MFTKRKSRMRAIWWLDKLRLIIETMPLVYRSVWSFILPKNKRTTINIVFALVVCRLSFNFWGAHIFLHSERQRDLNVYGGQVTECLLLKQQSRHSNKRTRNYVMQWCLISIVIRTIPHSLSLYRHQWIRSLLYPVQNSDQKHKMRCLATENHNY